METAHLAKTRFYNKQPQQCWLKQTRDKQAY